MKLIQLDIVGLSNSQTQSGAFALVLGEIGGKRRLPIVIGNFEAKAIAIALDNEYKSQRPITHDLFKTLAYGFKINVQKVVISSINPGGIFSSIIYCVDNNGKEVELDSRTSDAVAISIRFRAPIFTYEAIINEAGIILEKDVISTQITEPDESQENSNGFKNLSTKELEVKLNEAIENEDYELASKIRDEINKRS
ncbi:bifunctional nuclease family protein [Flavobacteriales bacterium]|nr:bifunctional nuclease family protein [Flavobacteriales bacterium]MDC3103806.1 bifunctional nuclease family protein [Flavobacteriales bacterium]